MINYAANFLPSDKARQALQDLGYRLASDDIGMYLFDIAKDPDWYNTAKELRVTYPDVELVGIIDDPTPKDRAQALEVFSRILEKQIRFEQLPFLRRDQSGESRIVRAHELEILRCLAQGYSYKEICLILDKPYSGMLTQIAKLKERLGVNSSHELLVAAIDLGILNYSDVFWETKFFHTSAHTPEIREKLRLYPDERRKLAMMKVGERKLQSLRNDFPKLLEELDPTHRLYDWGLHTKLIRAKSLKNRRTIADKLAQIENPDNNPPQKVPLLDSRKVEQVLAHNDRKKNQPLPQTLELDAEEC